MAKYQKQWAKKQRAQMYQLLGWVCKMCDKEKRKMEFDCIIPQGDRHHRMDTSARICFYRKQYQANNLQLLCRQCHIKKTKKEQNGLHLF